MKMHYFVLLIYRIYLNIEINMHVILINVNVSVVILCDLNYIFKRLMSVKCNCDYSKGLLEAT